VEWSGVKRGAEEGGGGGASGRMNTRKEVVEEETSFSFLLPPSFHCDFTWISVCNIRLAY